MQPVPMASASIHTIADIAELAGVSKSTVSRALNDSPLISAETKERIREIAQEHDFQMNDPARRLSLKQSHVVALVTYAYKADSAVPDAFMLEIMSGVSAGLHASGYDLLVIQVSPNDTDWVRRYLESGRVDGFVLMAASCTRQHIERARRAKGALHHLGPAAGTARVLHGQRRQLRRRQDRDRAPDPRGAEPDRVPRRCGHRGRGPGSVQGLRGRPERGRHCCRPGARRVRRLLRRVGCGGDSHPARAGGRSRRGLREQRPDGDRGDRRASCTRPSVSRTTSP